jgi:hypothetical protein
MVYHLVYIAIGGYVDEPELIIEETGRGDIIYTAHKIDVEGESGRRTL